MIRYLLSVVRRVAVVLAICDLIPRFGLPLPITPLQFFGVLMIVGVVRGEWMDDHELHAHLEKDRAVKTEAAALPLARLIGIGLVYGTARLVIWALA